MHRSVSLARAGASCNVAQLSAAAVTFGSGPCRSLKASVSISLFIVASSISAACSASRRSCLSWPISHGQLEMDRTGIWDTSASRRAPRDRRIQCALAYLRNGEPPLPGCVRRSVGNDVRMRAAARARAAATQR
eukprot:6172299-Pleurochrysis_carterae.AAC.1